MVVLFSTGQRRGAARQSVRHWRLELTQVIRATVKGNLVVAMVQGALGGLIFRILGIHGLLLSYVLMAFLSLLPATGAGMVVAYSADTLRRCRICRPDARRERPGAYFFTCCT
jgi:hypothetical protein